MWVKQWPRLCDCSSNKNSNKRSIFFFFLKKKKTKDSVLKSFGWGGLKIFREMKRKNVVYALEMVASKIRAGDASAPDELLTLSRNPALQRWSGVLEGAVAQFNLVDTSLQPVNEEEEGGEEESQNDRIFLCCSQLKTSLAQVIGLSTAKS
jgi:hypothetical protein